MYNMEWKLQNFLPFINSNNHHGSQNVLSKPQVIDLKQKARLKKFSAEKWLFLSAERIKEHSKTCKPSFDR